MPLVSQSLEKSAPEVSKGWKKHGGGFPAELCETGSLGLPPLEMRKIAKRGRLAYSRGGHMSSQADISKDAALALLRIMLLARRIEERMIRLYHQGRIFGGVYCGFGQEAIGTATTAAADADDLFAPCIRDMTVHLGRGTTPLGSISAAARRLWTSFASSSAASPVRRTGATAISITANCTAESMR
ncbi:MAG: thiamine pyrophosphate-dependent enzyme [Kiritimatiellaeota bacterium]|nr:thiamine pyrophosphate-dependent enzyme [Kiritimatiellota bacterium]